MAAFRARPDETLSKRGSTSFGLSLFSEVSRYRASL